MCHVLLCRASFCEISFAPAGSANDLVQLKLNLARNKFLRSKTATPTDFMCFRFFAELEPHAFKTLSWKKLLKANCIVSRRERSCSESGD